MKNRVVVSLTFIWLLAATVGQADTTWVRTYNGPSSAADLATAIAIDDSGYVYVTGYSYGGGTHYDFATIKYSPNGEVKWTARYNGAANFDDQPRGLAVDGYGNAFVTGLTHTSQTIAASVTIKYLPDGDTGWVRIYKDECGGWNEPRGIAAGRYGDVYVTGSSYCPGTLDDYVIIKYRGNGDEAWVRRFNGPANNLDVAVAIAVDSSDNVYVTGSSYDDQTIVDFLTVKYDSSGNEVWASRFDGLAHDRDEPAALVVDGSGNVYVTGLVSPSDAPCEFATLKYYPNGDTAWVRVYVNSPNSSDRAVDIAVDDLNNVYVTGLSWDSASGFDYATIKYDPDGNQVWLRRYNGPSSRDDYVSDIVVDDLGNVCVTGYSRDSIYFDYATVKYDRDGNLLLEERYDGPTNSEDVARALTVDGSGSIYVTGYSYGDGTERDYATLKYSGFLRGDANNDGKVSVSDIVFLVNYLFKSGPAPSPAERGDANCNASVTISDIVYLVNYLFKGGPQPCG